MQEAIATGFMFLLGLIQAVAFFVLKGLRSDINLAHQRITDQAEKNNNKFARRDDMAAMEKRILERIDAMDNKLDQLILRK